MPLLPAEQYLVLRSVYEWCFVGRRMVPEVEIPGLEGPSGNPSSVNPVQDYFVWAEVYGRVENPDGVMSLLAGKGLIRVVATNEIHCGHYELADGRVAIVEPQGISFRMKVEGQCCRGAIANWVVSYAPTPEGTTIAEAGPSVAKLLGAVDYENEYAQSDLEEGACDPDRVRQLAYRVRGLLGDRPGFIEHLRTAVSTWVAQYAQWRREEIAFEQARDREIERRRKRGTLGYEGGKKPRKPTSKKHEYSYQCLGLDRSRQPAEPCYGWLPTDFENPPKPSLPLPLPADHELSRSEKCAVIAAIHDAWVKGEKIAQWGKAQAAERQPYDGLLELAKRPSLHDIEVVERWIVVEKLADAVCQTSDQETAENSRPTDKRLAEIPPYDANSDWVTNKLAAELESVQTATLTDYRTRGASAPDRMSGIDKDGRMWRKLTTKQSHPRYYRPSLKKSRQRS